MKLSDLNPHIRYARVHKTFFHTKKAVSKCYDCRIFFFDDISGNVVINNKKYSIGDKTAIYLPPATEYKFNFDFNENGRVTVIDFDLTNEYEHLTTPLGTAAADNFDENHSPSYPIPAELSQPVVRTAVQIAPILTQCTDNFILKKSFYRENSSALLKLCLLEIARLSSKSTQSPLCEKVLEYIHENYTISTLTNEEIAAKFKYHPYHLSRMIKQETGKTLHNYLIYYRVRIAKDLLLTTQYDISEVAWRSGFCSPSYFIKIFRQNTGITPKEYRRFQLHIEI